MMAQDIPDWPPWSAPDADSDTDPTYTGLSLPLPGCQNWDMGPIPLESEFLTELNEYTQPPELPHTVSSLHSNLQFTLPPIAPLPYIQPVELSHQPTATYPTDQPAPVFPQLVGQGFTPDFYSLPNEAFLSLAAHQNDGNAFQLRPGGGGGGGSSHSIPCHFSNMPEAMGLPKTQAHDVVEAGSRVPVPLSYDNVVPPPSHMHATSGCETDNPATFYPS